MGADGKLAEELGRRKEGEFCGMGCCSCLALIRGRVLLERTTPCKEMYLPNPLAAATPPFRTRTPPRMERALFGIRPVLLAPLGVAGMV